MTDIPTLTTERLTLRAFRATDLDAYAECWGDAEVVRHISGQEGWTRNETGRHMAAAVGHWHLYGFGLWAMADRSDDRVLGVVGVFDYPQNGVPEIGWVVARRAWGRGLASEAARASIRFAFEERGIPRLDAVIAPGNAASIRIAEKLGFVFEREFEKGGHTVGLWQLARG